MNTDLAYPSLAPLLNWASWSLASRMLMLYGAAMWLAFGLTYLLSLNDARTLREVGIWLKPMKFMAATALFAWTTVWLTEGASSAVAQGSAYPGICALIVVTSLFEVVYITYQASQGAASHYNTSDRLHALLFGLMAVAAVGLTGSQAWLAWEIVSTRVSAGLSVTTWGVVLGLSLTFVLSTVSGFLLGGNQPPAGPGLPWVGWHLSRDIRPSHFLGVHAQQLIPLLGILADRFCGAYAGHTLGAGTVLYLLAWSALTLTGLSH